MSDCNIIPIIVIAAILLLALYLLSQHFNSGKEGFRTFGGWNRGWNRGWGGYNRWNNVYPYYRRPYYYSPYSYNYPYAQSYYY
ncbi:hypothetical protein QJ854_gp364 [Moumouvirus goulette]|uniref:Uncharacterized protein n=1 Tax=Moumouvirus goulette TaxID=1247379 RepID=M1PH85_9VIRU|nr:hypothetical protein QJ854_gp364 [Moumouvirus goulette]AGF85418.1 hypothetical protein glt_00609 [Moumouvirus goulette]